MNIKGFRRMLLGEKMPDRNDPKYKERYEREVNAGRRFAKATRIDKRPPRCRALPTCTAPCSLSSYLPSSPQGWHGTSTG